MFSCTLDEKVFLPAHCCNLLKEAGFFFLFRKLSPLPEEGLDEQYRLPIPEDLGISKEYLSPWRGGETAGLLRLKEHLKNQVSSISDVPAFVQNICYKEEDSLGSFSLSRAAIIGPLQVEPISIYRLLCYRDA